MVIALIVGMKLKTFPHRENGKFSYSDLPKPFALVKPPKFPLKMDWQYSELSKLLTLPSKKRNRWKF